MSLIRHWANDSSTAYSLTGSLRSGPAGRLGQEESFEGPQSRGNVGATDLHGVVVIKRGAARMTASSLCRRSTFETD
jgi:hypothetical protein